MSRVREHAVAEGASFCTHCGTTTAAIAVGKGCIWRELPDERSTIMRPEPALRPVASEDSEAISARLAELRAERDAAINRKDDP
jgi:hypothetical protein